MGHPEEEKRGGREIKIVRPGNEEQEKTLGKQTAPDDAGHGKAVINPARGKGDQERRQGEYGDDDADLHAVEPDLQKMEGNEEKDGRDRECAGEIDEVDSPV